MSREKRMYWIARNGAMFRDNLPFIRPVLVWWWPLNWLLALIYAPRAIVVGTRGYLEQRRQQKLAQRSRQQK